MTTLDELMHLQPVNPGMTTLPRLMRKYNIASQHELAIRAEIPFHTVEEISDGRKKIDEATANSLSRVVGRKSANLMLKMQKIADFYEVHGRRPNAWERKKLLISP